MIGKNVQPVEEILAEGSGSNGWQVSICCHYHADIYGDWMIVPHPLKFSLL